MESNRQKKLIPELLDEKDKRENPPNLFREDGKSSFSRKKIRIAILCLAGFILIVSVIKVDMPVSGIARIIPSKFAVVEAVEEGVIEKLNFSGGDKVKEGDLICTLYSSELSEETKEARLKVEIGNKELLQSEEKSNYLKTMVERNEDLYKEDVIALAELEKIKLEYSRELQQYGIYKDELETAKNKVEYLREALKNTEIKAPISGLVITKIEDKIGTFVKKGDTICEVAYMDEVLLELPVDEKVLKSVAPGDVVSITFLAYPNKSIKGKVVKIHHVAWEKLEKVIVKENVINVLIKPDSLPFGLKPGMTARVKIHCGKIGIKEYL